MASVFVATDPYKGASPDTRRSIAKLNINSPACRKLRAAIDSLGIMCKSPYYREDCFAHIGLPNLCIAITTCTQSNATLIETQRERWAKYRHKSFMVSVRSLERMSVEQVAAQLTDALKAQGKMK